jgi:KDO2-lipid IV(A) lauroyltransferase
MKKEISTLMKIRYAIEVIFVYIFIIGLGKILGIRNSSGLFGLLAKLVGKRISPNKTAYKNLKRIFPSKSDEEIQKIAGGVWESLGRATGEFPFIEKFDREQLEKYLYVGKESKQNLDDIRKSKKGHIIFSAHLANWEMGLKYFKEAGLNIKAVYRPLNNIYLDKVINDMRGLDMLPKNKKGARQLLKDLKDGATIVMLIDQKMNDGIEVPFFGIPAMTPSAIANLALKLDIQITPARVIRKSGSVSYELEVEKPMSYEKTNNIRQDIVSIMTKINKILERWIREHPEQWFWVHNRWK